MPSAIAGDKVAKAATPLTYGEKIAAGLKVVANNVRKMSSGNAVDVAEAVEKLSNDEMLTILDKGDGAMDYMIEQINELLPLHLRPLAISQIRGVRDAVAAGQSGTDLSVSYG